MQWTRRSRGRLSGRRFLPREHHVLHRGTFIALQFFGSNPEHFSQFKQGRVHIPLVRFTHELDAFVGACRYSFEVGMEISPICFSSEGK